MKTSDFYYHLPKELIAQTPLKNRDESKLMILDRSIGSIEHSKFKNIIDHLNEGDCLVLNNTKVIPARLFGIKEDNKSIVEILLLNRYSKEDISEKKLEPLLEKYSKNGDNIWECLVKPGKKAKIGTKLIFGNGILVGEIIDILPDGNRIISFTHEGIFEEVLDELGSMPLPPYIKERLEDKNRYQTVYAKFEGSAAAPTAGLHFTNELLELIREKGVSIAFVTLHVGLGTFRPVKVDDVQKHHMHSEYFNIDKTNADIINNTIINKGRIIAVGTTSCRTLESATLEDGLIKPCSGDTDIFIYPGYNFKIVDALITNFHLPESTLLMLISALYDRENILSAYAEAIKYNYRFFSFGDAMFIK